MKTKKDKNLFPLFILICILFVASIIILVILPYQVTRNSNDISESGKSYNRYHILVTGTTENEAFLNRLYKGASSVAKEYDAAVDLLVPESHAEDVSLQSLMDYASFVEADGVIAYINSTKSGIQQPQDLQGDVIPLISVGYYDPDLHQVSFIGTNYSELGQTIAGEIISCLQGKGRVLLINTNTQNDPNYSVLMNVVTNMLEQHRNIQLRVMDVKSSTVVSIESSIKKQIVLSDGIDLIVCLSEENTIRIAQTVTDLNKAGKIGIIGLGESDEAHTYYEKGIITELISMNPEKIGERAMKELFEYKNNGSANSIIIADVRVLKKESK